MSVYVDNFAELAGDAARVGRLKMSHMVADSLDELHAMADKIGVARKWFQPQHNRPHYDICKAKRALAIQHGAKNIPYRQVLDVIKRCVAGPPNEERNG